MFDYENPQQVVNKIGEAAEVMQKKHEEFQKECDDALLDAGMNPEENVMWKNPIPQLHTEMRVGTAQEAKETKEAEAKQIIKKALEEIVRLGLKPELDFGCNLNHVTNPSENDFVFYPIDEGN